MKEKKVTKILYVIGSLERGGAEIHLTRILPLIDAAGYEVNVFCFIRKGGLASQLEKDGVRVFQPFFTLSSSKKSLPTKIILTIFSIFSFLFQLVRVNPDIIHFFLPSSYMLFGPLCLFHLKSTKIMSRRSRNLYQKKYPSIVRSVEIWLHKRMSYILANSKRVMADLEEEKVLKEKLHLIYNGINCPSVYPGEISKSLTKFNLAPDDIVLTIVANLIPYKGHKDLIKACSLLKMTKWKLLIVGDDAVGYQRDLEKLVSEFGLQQKIFFLGARADVEKIYSISDIALLASHQEGFSNAILEGMCASLPMIVTDVGGNSEAVVHNETGLVVSPHDPEGFQSALERLMSDSMLRKEMGEKGKLRVRKYFSIEQCVEKYLNIYSEVNIKKIPRLNS